MKTSLFTLAAGLCLAVLAACSGAPTSMTTPAADAAPRLRFATFNTSLFDDEHGGLIARLDEGDADARKIAAIIQHQRPDIVLLNEFDYDAQGRAAQLFMDNYLADSQFGQPPVRYPYHYLAEVNTGVPSGLDLDQDGQVGGQGRLQANDAWGYGLHPGQYGMLVLSMYPIDEARVRSFRLLPWSSLPGALQPTVPGTGKAFYPESVWTKLRLSSKSHWDLPIDTPQGRIHFLVAHPTPPVFDGPERRNAARNHDEIRLWSDYISPGDKPWLCDDAGHCGGLAADARFVIAGDYNADPAGGGSLPGAIHQLLENPRVLRYATPGSEGALVAGKDPANATSRSYARHHTASFGERNGNYRVDYVLPSVGLPVQASGVFWPRAGESGADWLDATDHRMVWVDLAPLD